jgi:hypothetical protein
MTETTLTRLALPLAALAFFAAVILSGGCAMSEPAGAKERPAVAQPEAPRLATVQPVDPPICQGYHDLYDCQVVMCDPPVANCGQNIGGDQDCDGVDETGFTGPRDNCALVCDPTNTDTDGDGRGDVCDSCPLSPLDDADGDGICEDTDNCPAHTNAGQEDADADSVGDACDQLDGDPGQASEQRPDGWPDVNCNGIARPDEGTCTGLAANLLSLVTVCSSLLADDVPCDSYVDTTGGSSTSAVCNASVAHDLDMDGWGNACDNCDNTYNPGQADGDADGTGDACDS